MKHFDVRIYLAHLHSGFDDAFEGRPFAVSMILSLPYHDGYRGGLNALYAAECPRTRAQFIRWRLQ